MANITMEELLQAGVPLEDILFNKQSAPINVKVETDDLAEAIERAAVDNKQTLTQIKEIISKSNQQNQAIVVKAMQMLSKDKVKTPGKKEIKGIRVNRNELKLIDTLEFIY